MIGNPNNSTKRQRDSATHPRRNTRVKKFIYRNFVYAEGRLSAGNRGEHTG
jgi:hypothetical protein